MGNIVNFEKITITPENYLKESLKKLNNSLIVIIQINKDYSEKGFFIKIMINKKEYYFLVFNNYKNQLSELNIIYNNASKIINTEKRFTKYINKPNYITFIEIFDEEIIKDKDNFQYLIKHNISDINSEKTEEKLWNFLGNFLDDLTKDFLKYKCEAKNECIYDYLNFIMKKDCKKKKDYYEFFNFIKTNRNRAFFIKASIFDNDDYNVYRNEFNNKLKGNKTISFTELEKSCIGSILGMAIGDAIGARVEFLPLNYDFNKIVDMGNGPGGKFKLEPGQWTDDTSMGLCIADSLIEKKGEFNARDIMMRFILWWFCGYNNAFRFDKNRPKKNSVGLGGNISESIYQFVESNGKNEYTISGDKKTSGNGSIMRNAAIPICYFREEGKALEYAKRQSLITHQGDEAAGCCQLMTFIIIKILKLKRNNMEGNNNLVKILDNLKDDFKCGYKSVNYLAQSRQEGTDKNRNWNWKDHNFRYSESRAERQPGYIGSYCMDGLAMALHILYTTDNFKGAILKAVNLCGDADSVGSIVGQISGAYYGLDSIPENWINTLNKWDKNEIALRGYILCNLFKN